MRDEHFIPFRKTAVVSMCADELPAEERQPFVTFTDLLASLLHHRTLAAPQVSVLDRVTGAMPLHH